MDLDPAIFVIDLQEANKNLIKKKCFCLLLFSKVHLLFKKVFLLITFTSVADPGCLSRIPDPDFY